MTKLTLSDLASLTSESSAIARINANHDLIEAALENTLSRDGTSPNQMEADLDLNSYDILNVNSINVETMTLDGYVISRDSFGDITAISVSEGAWKENCATATSAPITLSGEQTINDVTTSNSRVLVKDQADATTNGIYVSASGAWTRAEDFDSTADIEEGAIVYIEGDATSVGDKIYIMSTAGTIVLGTTALEFRPITSPVRYTTFKNIPTNEYTVTASDKGKQLVWSGSVDCFVTLPSNNDVRIGAGAEIEFLLSGTGTITFLAGTGVTLRTPYGESITRQWVVAKAKKRSGAEWHLSGGILAVGSFGKDWLEAETDTDATALLGGNLDDIHNLSDPNADRFLGWDDSAGAVTYFTFGTGLSVSGTSVTVSLGWDDITGDPSDNALFAAHNHDDRYYTEAETTTLLASKQSLDTDLTTIAALAPSNDDIIQRKAGAWTNRTMAQLVTDLGFSGVGLTDGDKGDITVSSSGTVWTIDSDVISTYGRTLVDDANASAARTTLGVAIGTNVQAWDADLDAIAALTPSNDDIIQCKAGAWTNRTIAQLQTDLGLATSYQPLDSDLTTIAGLTATTDNFIQAKSSAWASRTPAQVAADLSSLIKPVESFIIACSDETTALTTGTSKVTFRMPYAFTVTAVRASVNTAPTGGTLLTVDINESGTTILSTKLTFDASEKTTTTAATAAVISDSSLADDAEISIDIDAVGSTIAGAGLKVYIIGTRT